MPTTFAVSRPWQLNLGGNQPDEWSMAPYNGRRTTLAVYSASQAQPTSSWGFYDWTNGAEARTSAAVRMVDLNSVVNPGKPSAAFYVINGLAPSGTSGINFVARFALLTCIRTFLDAGAPTGCRPKASPTRKTRWFGWPGLSGSPTSRGADHLAHQPPGPQPHRPAHHRLEGALPPPGHYHSPRTTPASGRPDRPPGITAATATLPWSGTTAHPCSST